MDLSLQNIEKVVEGFYSGTQNQEHCNEFLTFAQQSPEAWTFCWQLLDPSKSQMVQFYGALVLHTKIEKFWSQLSPSDYPTLYAKLLSILELYSKGGPKLVLSKLCSALSCFIIQEVKSVELSKTSNFSQDLCQQLPLLLEVYSFLPEEFYNCQLLREEKYQVNVAIRSWKPRMVHLVTSILGHNDSTLIDLGLASLALKCYSNWTVPEIDLEVEMETPLIGQIFKLTAQDEICSLALEALTQFITHPALDHHPQTVYKFVEHLVQLEPFVARAMESGDLTLCQDLFGLIVSTGERHAKYLLEYSINKPETKQTIFRLFHLILKCNAIPGHFPVDETCSELTFSFWFALQEELVNAPKAHFEKLLLTYNYLFHSLVDVYMVKARYPPDHIFAQWQDDEREAFRCYRQDISDSLMYCFNVLQESMMANLMAHLELALMEVSTNWQYLEACLMAFGAVACSLENSSSVHLEKFFAMLPSIPMINSKMAATAMETIGSYSEWLSSHPNSLQQVIPFLLSSVRVTQMVSPASLALKDITRDCKDSLGPYSHDILATSLDVLKNPELRCKERIRLMGAVGQILSLHPQENIMTYLTLLLGPLFQQLLDASKHTPQQIHDLLSSTTALLESLECPPNQSDPPALIVLSQLLPLLSSLSATFSGNELIAEAICDLIKKSVRTLSGACEPLLTNFLQLITVLTTIPEVIDLSKQLLILFANVPERREELQNFYNQLCSHILSLFQPDLHVHTHLVEALFIFFGQLVKKAIHIVEGNPTILPSIFQCAIAALALPEKFTLKAATFFLGEFIHHSRENPTMTSLVNSHGEQLVDQLCKMIAGGQPRTQLEPLVDVLMALSKKYFDNLGRWLSAALLQSPHTPLATLTQPSEREAFIRSILRERANKRKMKDIVMEFSLQCRGLYGTEYAKNTL